MSGSLSFVLLVFLSSVSFANEKIESSKYWLSHSFAEVQTLNIRGVQDAPAWQPHSLAWPVAFEDAQHSMGNSMAEFQSYGDGPYYHGGCDLRVKENEVVHTPVAGRIEAGHYGYSNNPNGSNTKWWKPWPQGGDSHYFEVAVITDDNYRFEFHHMDENQLPAQILAILKNGGKGRVEAGTLLGQTISWPDGVYHHTHYNIISPGGVHLNPEFYSPLVEDHQAPVISKVLASFKSGKTMEFGSGRFMDVPDFFAVAVIDHQDQNIYDHPPSYAGIEFADGKKFSWDFRERLAGPDGLFPALWDFFIESIRAPNGEQFATEGGYGQGVSVVRVKVPAGAMGAFTLKIADEAGNTTSLQGSVGL